MNSADSPFPIPRMKILVTGAAGFIGTHLCNELRGRHYVIATDMRDGDLRDPYTIANLLDIHHPEVVIHLAAKVGRLFGEDSPADTIVDNAGMTAIVSKACGERGIRLVYASTSEIYGDMGDTMAHEDMWGRGRVHNLYGLSKRWGEEVAHLYSPRGLTCLRLSMPYGPGLPAGRGRAAMINFLYNALRREPITVHRNSERSWCWIGDTVRGIRMVVEEDLGNDWNVGRDDNATSMLEVAQRACDMTGAPHDIIEEIDPPGMQTVVKRLSTEKLRSIGWEPEVELEEGMARTLAWIKEGFPPITNKEE